VIYSKPILSLGIEQLLSIFRGEYLKSTTMNVTHYPINVHLKALKP